MRLYLDTSALVKLIHAEPETAALRRFLRRHREDGRVCGSLSRTELIRVARRGGTKAVGEAQRLLHGLDQVRLEPPVLDDAAALMPPELRSLDAIHLACARQLGRDLRALVTYDRRMARAAVDLGMRVEAPG